ncbi:MAG: endonuclease [Bacteroidota bacterium]
MKFTLLLTMLVAVLSVSSQQTGYYNGTEGKNGDELKTALHDIIKGHVPYTYFSTKYIFIVSDVDPDDASKVIQVYTGFPHANNDYGTSGLELNREHVWAKSHGNFADWMPMYSDVHNLKPAAASVNQSRSNKDFANGGVPNAIATECYSTDSSWEARDQVKGDIARIIFYMATRYEGGNGEIDLTVVDHVNTFPLPEHGKLSTLIEWNEQDPPDEFERNRNNRIFDFQHNRNPFIDNPEMVDLIWGDATANAISITGMTQSLDVVFSDDPVQIDATITSTGGAISSAQLWWGTSFENLNNEVDMTTSGDEYTGNIPAHVGGETIYFNIVANDDVTNEKTSVTYSYYVQRIYSGSDIVSIYDIQGQQAASPYEDQIVTTTGIVTSNLGLNYFIQDGNGLWNGLFIYDLGRNVSVGDSVIITGKIVEYYGLTEMKEISDFYFVSANHELPNYMEVATGAMEEGHEGILAKIANATCVNDNFQGNYGMWTVDDGTGELEIRNTAVFEYYPSEGKSYDVKGPVNWDYSEWKIEITAGEDVQETADINGPTIVSAEPIINTNIKVIFNEEVDETTAHNIENYVLNNDVTIEAAIQHSLNKAQVNLTVSEMSGGDYVLIINNMQDLVGNITIEQSYEFSYLGIDDLFVNGEVSIYPNPTNNKLNVSFNAKENTVIEIGLTDISGRLIMTETYSVSQGVNKFVLNVTDVSKGIYLLNITEDTSSLMYKVIIK